MLENLSFYMKHGLKGYHGNRHSWLGETVVNGYCWIAAQPKRPGKMTEIYWFVYKMDLRHGKWIFFNFWHTFESIRFHPAKIIMWRCLVFRYQSNKNGSYENKHVINYSPTCNDTWNRLWSALPNWPANVYPFSPCIGRIYFQAK